METNGNEKQSKLKITGMTCASCVATIEKSVKNLDGILDIKVNLGNEEANIIYNPSKVSYNDIERKITDLGYKVVNERADIKIGGMHCAACVSTLEKAIGAVNGVARVTVNLNTEQATVMYNPKIATVDEVKQAITRAGYQYVGMKGDANTNMETTIREKDLREKVWRFTIGIGVGVFLMVLMILFPHDPSMGGHMELAMVLSWFHFLVATPAFVFTSFPIFKAAYASLKNKALNMDVMYAMGIGIAYGASVLGTFVNTFSSFMFYDAAVMLAGFLMLGRYLEARAKGRTSDAIKKLVGLQPKTATVIREGKEMTIAAGDIREGDIVIIKPGERVPADGTVNEGTSYIDESMITGEPIPVLKKPAMKVIGGTINKNSVLKFEANRVGKDTMLSQIIKLVEEAQGSKPPIQKLADTAVKWFIPAILAIAIGVFFTWLAIMGSLLVPLTRLITILVVACPCALGLATPTAVTVGIGRGAELGILIKNGEVLEKVHKLTTVVFDKTGTLTKGTPEITDIITYSIDDPEFLGSVASVERYSQHPLAGAIVRAATEARIEVPPATGFDTVEGRGVRATVAGKPVLVGSRSYLVENGTDVSLASNDAERLENEGKTVVHAAIGGKVAGIFGIADTLREGAPAAVSELRDMGISTMIITGDNARTARAIASKIGIQDVIAEVLPQDKARKVQELQDKGNVVAFVGDGINDAPALARADVGIAMGGGTDIAIESGELIVMKDDPIDAVAAIQLSKQVLSRIKLNLFWAFAYNSALIPIAIFGVVAPELAGLIMAMSSVTVVSLSLLLKRYVPGIKKNHPGTSEATPAGAVHVDSMNEANVSHDAPSPELRCRSCDKALPVPVHCNQPMHIETVNGKEMLVCWMGPECGAEDIPVHCGKPMVVTGTGDANAHGDARHHDSHNVSSEAGVLKCTNCGERQPVPQHCGKSMHVENIDGRDMFVCWMGPDCGKQDIPTHCSQPMHET